MKRISVLKTLLLPAVLAVGTPGANAAVRPDRDAIRKAKQQATMHGVAIDMPAGPSEVLVIADDEANPEFVAADFLSQAEHGPDSQSILLTTSLRLTDRLPEVIERLLSTLPRRDMMNRSLEHSRIILLGDMDEVMEFSNDYAPEHLIINHRDAR